jgi:hypothetical protein
MNNINRKRKSLLYYYAYREKRIKYQRKYDKSHKEMKREYDKKRRETTNKNRIRKIQSYSHKKYFKVLLKKYKGCELCGSKKKLELHHKKYTKNIKDVMLLCQPCHKKLHRSNFE